jgi:hypothetical protein
VPRRFEFRRKRIEIRRLSKSGVQVGLGFQPGDFVIAFMALALFEGQGHACERALALLGKAGAVIVQTTSAKPAYVAISRKPVMAEFCQMNYKKEKLSSHSIAHHASDNPEEHPCRLFVLLLLKA